MNRRRFIRSTSGLLVPAMLPSSARAGLIGMSGSRLLRQAEEGGGGGGELAHGDSVTITGSGFGTMPTFYFAGGANGALETTSLASTPNEGHNQEGDAASAGMNWTRYSSPYATVATDATRGKVLYMDDYTAQEYKFPSTIPLGGKFMVKYYALYDSSNDGPGSGPGGTDPQIKFMRIQAGTTAIEDTAHNMVFTYLVASTPPEWMFYVNSAGGAGSSTHYLIDELGDESRFPAINGIWSRVEKKITAPTSQGASNGRMLYRAIRAGAASAGNYASFTDINGNPDSARYSAITWQNWSGNGMRREALGFRLDDQYVSLGTFKCVELWNSTTPANATLREIQEPTTWSDTSITVRLNKGGLSAGTYYLVVLDDAESDIVLASKEITIQ